MGGGFIANNKPQVQHTNHTNFKEKKVVNGLHVLLCISCTVYRAARVVGQVDLVMDLIGKYPHT